MGGDERRRRREPPKLEIPPALAAAAALVVAVLASVGVSGEALTRAVRNDPGILVGTIAIVLLVVAGTTAYLNRANRVLATAFGLLGVLLTTLVVVGAVALGEREQPRVSLSSRTDGDLVTVTVEAAGSSLKSGETMLVQVHALDVFPVDGEGRSQCERSRFERYRDPKPDWPGPLLLWEQAGPGPDGTVAVESAFEVDAGDYAGVCAFAALTVDGREPRYAASYLRLPAAVGVTDPPAEERDGPAPQDP